MADADVSVSGGSEGLRTSVELAGSAGGRRDPNLPRTWYRDLQFARALLGGVTPLGVLWVQELKGGARDVAKPSYRLVVISDFRVFVTNGKVGIVSGIAQNAHLFDLERICVKDGDRIELHFKKLSVILDDTVGPQIVSTIWTALSALSYEVPAARLPQLDAGAQNLIDAADALRASHETLPVEGFVTTYRAACDYFGVKPRSCVESYLFQNLAAKKPEERGSREFNLGVACRDQTADKQRFTCEDLPAIARALAVTSHFDAVVLDGRSRGVAPGAATAAQLTGEASRALVCALEASNVATVRLVGVGLTAARLERPEAKGCWPSLTELDVSENALGSRGLRSLASQSAESAPRLRKLECRGCGVMRPLGLGLATRWRRTLVHLDCSRCDLGSKGTEALAEWLAGAVALETLLACSCQLHILTVLGAASNSAALKSSLKVVDLSQNRFADDHTGCEPCRNAAAQCAGLERLALARCELPLVAVDALLEGLEQRAAKRTSELAKPAGQTVALLSLYMADNAMTAKFGEVFFKRFVARGVASPPLQLLNLDRSHMGTLALRDLFTALAQSEAPHLVHLSVCCAASKGGMFANKRKHEEMARALADVVLRCRALERLFLAGGDGSVMKGDLLPALAALSLNKTLRVLDISNNLCGDDALQALAGSLSTNQALQRLTFDGNGASATAITAIAQALDKNTTLYDLRPPERDASLAQVAGDAAADAAVRKAMAAMREFVKRNVKIAQLERKKHPPSPKAATTRYAVPGIFAADGGGAPSTSFAAETPAAAAAAAGDEVPGAWAVAAAAAAAFEAPLPSMVDDDEDVFVDALESHDVPTEQLRPSASPAELSAEDRAARAKEVRHRLKIFEEIFESEANYVRDLGVICHVFMAPIEKHDIMSREELDRIFSNVRELRQIHCELLSKLRQAERRRKDLLLGGKVEKAAQQMAAEYAAIFATMVPFLRAYASYCVTYPSAIELVRTLADSRPKLQKFLELVKHVPQCRGLDLASFLIKPPQRLCKYPLFFNDLLKSLNPEDSKDSVDVIRATLLAVQGVANNVNASMAQQGSIERVYSVFKDQLDSHESVSDLVSPSRRFLLEGAVECASSDKPPKRHHFFLLNDLLLLATPKRSIVTGAELSGKFKVKHRFALVDLSILDAPAPISLNANDYNFLARFEDHRQVPGFVAHGHTAPRTMSVHWPAGAEPPRADFLMWCDNGPSCERLRGALQQAVYDVKMLQQGLVNRRRTTTPPATAAAAATGFPARPTSIGGASTQSLDSSEDAEGPKGDLEAADSDEDGAVAMDLADDDDDLLPPPPPAAVNGASPKMQSWFSTANPTPALKDHVVPGRIDPATRPSAQPAPPRATNAKPTRTPPPPPAAPAPPLKRPPSPAVAKAKPPPPPRASPSAAAAAPAAAREEKEAPRHTRSVEM